MNVSDYVTPAADGRPVLAGASCLPPMATSSRKTSKQATTPADDRREQGTPRKNAHRFGVLNTFVDCSLSGLSKAEIATWLCLYRDTRNGTACTAQTDIAKRAGLSVRAVKYAVQRLLAAGLLVRVYKGGLNQGPSRYRVEPLGKLVAPSKGQK
jgi:predicted transcriptional regulator